MAAKFISDRNDFNYIKFFIDSQAAILAVENSKVSSTLVREAKIELNKASKNKKITLCWTKAHVGTVGNEMADAGAKQGGMTGTESLIAIPKAELNNKIDEYFVDQWDNTWHNYRGGRMAKQFYPKSNRNQAKYVLKLGRLELSRFIRLVSGHNGLFYFKSRIDPEINSICRFCLEKDETFHHLVTDCPAFNLSRREIFLTDEVKTQEDWSVRNMLIFSYLPGIREAIEGQTDLHLFAYMSEDEEEDEFDPP